MILNFARFLRATSEPLASLTEIIKIVADYVEHAHRYVD